MKMKLTLVTIMFALLATLILGFARLPSASAEGANIWTNKPDYSSGETATIYGSGFSADANVTINVARPDNTIDTLYAVADASGSFTITYQLDGITGTYTVNATDGTNTATTTFTDETLSVKVYRDDPTAAAFDAASGATFSVTFRITNENTAGDSSRTNIGTYSLTFSGLTLVPGGPSTPGTFSLTKMDPSTKLPALILTWTFQAPTGPATGSITLSATITSISPSRTFPTGGDHTSDSASYAVTVLAPSFQPFKVSGYKTEYGGSGLSGWTIQLYKDTWVTPYATTPTAATTGYYEFTITEPGNYRIYEVVESGWTKITPAGDYYEFTATSGHADITDQNFVNFEWLTVSGTKSEYGGSGLSGWTIELYKGGVLYDSATTAVDGSYSITVKDPGTYSIKEVLKDKWTETAPVLTYSPGDGSTPSVLGYSDITVQSGVDITGKDFTNFQWMTISGVKEDTEGNGLQGWTIELYDSGGVYASTTTAASTGGYSFTVKDPGTYSIKEVLPSGWTEVSPEHHYGDGSSVLGYSDITVVSGQDITGKDFVNFEWLTVSGNKYEDTDGTRPTDSPLEDWTINLYKDSTLYDSTTTDVNGYYEFIVKDPGTYSIKEVLKDKWTETYPVLTYSPGDGSTPSVLGYSGLDVSSGVDVTGKDFWNFKWFTVSGYKFFDADGDGVRDAGEPGLQYWTIDLKIDSSAYASTTTDVNGYYQFTVKDPGTYTVSETLIAPWWIQTAPALGTYSFTAESGKNEVVDFGNWLGESIVTDSSYCWFDMEADATGPGRQFKLIFTPDVPNNPSLWRLTASNPGQFYYNVFYVGSLSTSDSFMITLPYPFVTQGAVPVHIYSSLNTGPKGCLIPGTDITSQFTITPLAITLDNYAGKFGITTTISVTSNGAYSGFVYITVHLDYGLKKTGGYDYYKIVPDALKNSDTIYNHVDYGFAVSGPVSDTQTVQNLNVFKRDPGFGGLVTDSSGNPVQGVKVQIYGPDGKLLATVCTDEDGWYVYNYKYTGKAATFTVTLPDYKLKQSVTLKANSFVVVNFQI